MKLITVNHQQAQMTLRSLIQRLTSASDGDRNLVNAIAPEPLRGFEPKHKCFPQSDQELIRFSRSVGHVGQRSRSQRTFVVTGGGITIDN